MEHDAELIKLSEKLLPLLETGQFDEARSAAERLEHLICRELNLESEALPAILNTLGWSYHIMGDTARALGLFRDELAIRDTLSASDTEILELVTQIAFLYDDISKPREALAFFRRGLALHRRNVDADPALLRGHIRYVALLDVQLAEYDEAEALFRELLEVPADDDIIVRTGLANVLVQKGAFAEAEGLLVATVQRGVEDGAIGISLGALGHLYLRRGEPARAVSLLEDSLAIAERLLPAADPQLGEALNNVGIARLLSGQLDAAEEVLRRAEDVMVAAEYGAGLPRVHSHLADVYRQLGRFRQAEAYAAAALEESLEMFGDEHPTTAQALNVLGLVYTASKRLDEALPLMHEAIRVWRTQPAGHLLDELATISGLAWVHLLLGEYEIAQVVISEAYGRAVGALGHTSHAVIAHILECEAQLHYMRGQAELALTPATEALEVRKRTQGERHPDYAPSLSTLARVLVELGRYAEAESLLVQATALELETLGSEHLRYGIDLCNLSRVCAEIGQFTRAEDLGRESLRIIKGAGISRSADVATALGNLAFIHFRQGDVTTAIELSREALCVDADALRSTHPKIAIALHNLAFLLVERGSYLEAQPLAVRALEITRDTLPRDSAGVPLLLSTQGEIQKHLGRYSLAEALLLEELEREQCRFGERHPYIAGLLTALAGLYREAGRLLEAAEHAERAVSVLTARGETDSSRYAAAVAMLGTVQQAQGRYTSARDNLLRARDIQARVAGDNSREHAHTLMNLGALYVEIGHLSEALPFQQHAVEVMRRIAGARHPDVAVALDNLAMLRMERGEFAAAEKLLLESREIRRETVGENGPDFALTLNNLSVIHSETGAHRSARRLLEQALKVERDLLEGPHPIKASTLGFLGAHHLRGDPAKAEELLREALEMRRVLLGNEHPEVAQTIAMLGVLHLYHDDLQEAERHCREALDLLRGAFPDAHPEIARVLNNLAAIAQRRGDFASAEALERDALAMWRLTRGEQHPGLVTPLANLSSIVAAQGRYAEALDLMLQLEALNDLIVLRVLPGSSEYRALSWLGSLQMSMEMLLSLVVKHLADSHNAVRLACDLVLRRKAVVFEVLARQRAAVRGRGQTVLEALHRLKQQRRLLTEAALAGPALEGEEAYRRRLAELETAVEEIEAEVARDQPAVGVEQRLRRADRPAIAAVLGAGAALIELVRFDNIDFNAVAPRPVVSGASYAAFIVRGEAPDDVQLLDLGDGDIIDREVDAFRAWLDAGPLSSDTESAGTSVRQLVFDPIARVLPDHHRWYVAPDGALHRLPLEALPGANGGRVLDTHHISYVLSGRDLVDFNRPCDPRHAARPLVVAGPDFDLGQMLHEPDDFAPLPGAAAEGRDVAAALGVKPLLGPKVLKATIERRRSPYILHLATHGFFLPRPTEPKPERPLAMVPVRDGAPGLSLFQTPPADPLLRSGLALAGANRARRGLPVPDGAGNGLLLAEDVLSLDLSGTELVVLSACKSGLGDVQGSEGVYGLRRTFLLAGARTVITSLWRVPDVETRLLMIALYQGIRCGLSRSEALRAAQKKLRDDPRTSHPFFWGAFICIGDPGRLPLQNPGTKREAAKPHEQPSSVPDGTK